MRSQETFEDISDDKISYSQISGEKIEPIGFSTMIGGSMRASYAEDVAVDADGYVYVTGTTDSQDFPVYNAMDSSISGETDCFLVKLSPDGSQIVYSTYIGGAGAETAYSIAVDDDGYVYLCGTTTSSDFPLIMGYDTSYNASGDAFVMKIDSDGNSIVWSTLLGGTYEDIAYDLQLDDSNAIYVTGATQEPEFPYTLLGELGHSDCFVVKLNPSGTSLEVSTVLSGGRDEEGRGIAVDESGNIYVTGSIESPYLPYRWPVVNAFQDTFGGVVDAFIIKLNSTGDGVIYSSFLGGGSHEFPRAIAIDDLGNAYIGGSTASSNFPLVNPYEGTFDLYSNAFATKVNATGNGLIYSTYLGGITHDSGQDIVIDDEYNAFIVGSTEVQDSEGYTSDGMLLKLNTTGNGISYMMIIGGYANEYIMAATLDDSGNIIVAGIGHPPCINDFRPGEGGAPIFVMSLHDMTDRDNDGLPDFDEGLHGTDPDNPDSDSDLMPDGYEVEFGLNPLLNDAADDLDGDGLSNYDEFLEDTYPDKADSDDDSLNDNDEVTVYHTNPLLNDTDHDLMPDGWEVQYGLDPLNDDAAEDADSDGLSNLDEYNYGTNPSVFDTDGDGRGDGEEVVAGTDPLTPDTTLEDIIVANLEYITIIPLVVFTGIVATFRTRIDQVIEKRQDRILGNKRDRLEEGE